MQRSAIRQTLASIFLTFAGASAIAQQSDADPLAAARSLVNGGQFAQAESATRNYLEIHVDSADAHFLLGYVLFREQKAKDSLAEFTTGAKFRRPAPDDLKIVASDYVLLEDYADADKWFTQVVRETPSDAYAWYLLGRTKYNLNNFRDAVSSFDRALALRPKYIEAENNLGLCWEELNDVAKARAAFQAAIDWQDDAPHDAQPFLNMGALLASQNDFDHALPYLARAAALSPGNPKIHEQLGNVYTKQQKLGQAQAELERAVELAPQTSALHYQLGQIYRKEGLRDRADKEFAICEKLSGTQSTNKTPNPIGATVPPPR